MSRRRSYLAPRLVEQVLSRLGFSAAPEPSREGLYSLYAAWCQHVPFDNVRKLIHLRVAQAGPLPGDSAGDFFEAWLRHGVGGTCWAGNGALQALLRVLGFNAERALATMLVAPNVPPNHGSVVVRSEQQRYLVDASILHGEPLPLDQQAPSSIAQAAWGVRCSRHDGRWLIRWRALHAPQGIDCRIERLRTSALSFHERHERSRPWSPFNYSLYARANRGERVIGIAFGQRVSLEADGALRQGELPPRQRAQFLIEQLGMDAALIALLPPDLPLPPAPHSASARRRGQGLR